MTPEREKELRGMFGHDHNPVSTVLAALDAARRERDALREDLDAARATHAAHLAIARETVPADAAERLMQQARAGAIEECIRAVAEQRRGIVGPLETGPWARGTQNAYDGALARLRALLEPGT